jgi:hypothetical protein
MVSRCRCSVSNTWIHYIARCGIDYNYNSKSQWPSECKFEAIIELGWVCFDARKPSKGEVARLNLWSITANGLHLGNRLSQILWFGSERAETALRWIPTLLDFATLINVILKTIKILRLSPIKTDVNECLNKYRRRGDGEITKHKLFIDDWLVVAQKCKQTAD